jgi:hypothetical protein
LSWDKDLAGDRGIKSIALKWGYGPVKELIRESQTEQLRNGIKDLIDNFIFACLSVNPPLPFLDLPLNLFPNPISQKMDERERFRGKTR